MFVSWGPNLRSTLSLASELGLAGDFFDPDDVEPSWSVTLDGALGFTIRDTQDRIKATILAPVRLGRLGIFGGLDEAVLADNEAFNMLQLGFGITDAGENLRGAVLWNYPFDDAVREFTPRFMLNLAAVLPRGNEEE